MSSFLAATIIPAQSELVLVGLHLTEKHSDVMLYVVATSGNVLGAVFNWVLGRYFLQYQHHRWFPLSVTSLYKAQATYQRWGVWTLLFSWLPIIGDPLTVVAGMANTRFMLFLTLVTIGKATRYIVILTLL